VNNPAITQYPTHLRSDAFAKTTQQKKEIIEKKFQEIMEALGLDLTDESLSGTPSRVAKMFVDEIFCGLDPHNFPMITLHEQKIDPKEIILAKNISFVSFCEHHFVPIFGKAHVAYLPQNKIIGLSKINRIVHYFAKRPQLQERMNAQIADSLAQVLQTENVAVALIAQHFCIAARGVEDREALTETHVLRGEFQTNEKRRSEFFTTLCSVLPEK
jgi:GTP cyclohydrolase I